MQFKQLTAAYRGIPKNLWLLALVMLINRSGAMVLLYMSIYLTQAKNYSIKEAGMVMTLYGLGSICGAYVGGKLTDRFGAFNIMVISLLGNGLLLMLLGQLDNLYAIGICTFFVTAVGDMFRPANAASLSFYATPDTYVRAVSLNRLAMNLGYSIGPMLGGFLAGINFKFLFIADGFTALAAATFLIYALKPPKEVGSKHKRNQAPVTGVSPFRNGMYLRFLLGCTLYALCFFQLVTAWPLYFKTEYHFSEPQIGGMMMINGIGVALLEMSLVHRIQHKWKELPLIRSGIVLLLISFGFLLSGHHAMILIVSMLLLTASEMLSMPFMNTYCMRIAPEGQTGAYMALYTMSWSAAMMLAPLMGSQAISRWGFAGLWWSVIACLALAFLVFLYVQRKIDSEAQC